MNPRKRIVEVCYVLSYRAPDYVRTRVLLHAMKTTDGLTVHEAINTATGFARYLQTLVKLLLIRIAVNPDLYILGFRGYEIFPLVRLLTAGKTLVFDHMMSPYDSLLHERHKVREGSLLDRIIYLYEKLILSCSDIVLTDTIEHKAFMEDLFRVPPDKIHAIPVGADEDLFRPFPPEREREQGVKPFQVLFYGTFLPLHGVEIILKAARVLRDRPISFMIIGGKGSHASSCPSLSADLNLDNVIHKDWIETEHLPRFIADADICLGGPFGDTGQANRVITGKTYQFLAMGKPTIVGRISHDYGFRDRENCLLVKQGDERELADAIMWCHEHQDLLPAIGRNGYELYTERFSHEVVSRALLSAFFIKNNAISSHGHG